MLTDEIRKHRRLGTCSGFAAAVTSLLLAAAAHAQPHVETPSENPINPAFYGWGIVQPNDTFGRSVAAGMLGTYMVVGSEENANWANGYAHTFRLKTQGGQSFYEYESLLVASDPTRDSLFGTVVETSVDELIIVGAPGACGGSVPSGNSVEGFGKSQGCRGGAGAAYVFRFDRASQYWLEEAKLVASDGRNWDHMGSSVAIYKDLALVGAPNVDNGKVYVYQFSEEGWVEVQILEPPNIEGVQVSAFGHSVAVYKDRAVIGAPVGTGGSVHFYEFDSAQQRFQRELTYLNQSFNGSSARLGHDVDISENLVVVGAPWGSNGGGGPGGTRYGFVQIFRHNGSNWQLTTDPTLGLPAPTNQRRTEFGSAVTVSTRPRPDHVMVGAPFWDSEGNRDEGKVFIFTEDSAGNWVQSGELTSSNPMEHDRFGSSVDLPVSFFSFGFVGAPTTRALGRTGTATSFELH